MKERVILSLCDHSGNWSQHKVDSGYTVIRIDLKPGDNLANSFNFRQDIRLLKHIDNIHGILAAPPCTHFAIVGARHWKSKTNEDLKEGLSVIDACFRIAWASQPKWWVLENPVGRLQNYIGKPQFKFQPWWYGDPWTKYTYLWGNFTPPLPLFTNSQAIQPDNYSTPGSSKKRGRTLVLSGGNTEKRRELRSETPKGFAEAFFRANP